MQNAKKTETVETSWSQLCYWIYEWKTSSFALSFSNSILLRRRMKMGRGRRKSAIFTCPRLLSSNLNKTEMNWTLANGRQFYPPGCLFAYNSLNTIGEVVHLWKNKNQMCVFYSLKTAGCWTSKKLNWIKLKIKLVEKSECEQVNRQKSELKT